MTLIRLLLYLRLGTLDSSISIGAILLAPQTEQLILTLLLLLENTWSIQVGSRCISLTNWWQNDLLSHLDDVISIDRVFRSILSALLAFSLLSGSCLRCWLDCIDQLKLVIVGSGAALVL